MKKSIVFIGLLSLFITGCSALQHQSQSAQQQQWQANNIKLNVNTLNKAPQYKGKVRVAAEVINGDVLLIGQAVDEEKRQSIEAYVQKLQGVDQTFNQIRIGNPISFDQVSYDTWLTTRVKSALLSDDRLDNYSISVVTENKEVFLMGNVPVETANIAADIASHIDGVAKVVKAFNYLRSSTSNASLPSTIAPIDAPTETSADHENNVEQDGVPIIDDPMHVIDEDDVM